MTAAGLPQGAGSALSIGSVLDALRDDFPEITISKIRFLESEGLISPARTPSGYRQFSHADIQRLRFVLSAQRDHYLPLKVIRAKLEEFDRAPTAEGPVLTASADTVSPAEALSETEIAAPETGGPGGGGPVGGGSGGSGGGDGGDGRRFGRVPDPRAMRQRGGLMAVGPTGDPVDDDPDRAVPADAGAGPDVVEGVDRETVLAEDGVDEALLTSLEHHGILRPDVTGRYEPEAPVIARTAASLAALGVEPRLLRGLRAGADREVGLLTQLVTPVARGRAPEASRHARELSGELASLSGRLHALLVGSGLRHGLRR
ncbi:MerR family transcriptional regulator [Actinomycetospora endophytica]|uniref:MerR family transcriptional regulator n=1 Tax=Actinomycetospora endophytica TaxID=2291215 RepID=A0ABS8PBG9_9PSEU|nr:MerR family transcriptional regulator [Actinomycetospora endophytica]MCD2194855.1 MerR family transcriptional regulator [Actinomycetospora endophytica]